SKGVPVAPVTVVSYDYVPAVGEKIGLCGYAHGSLLVTRGNRIDRVGPLLQEGIVSALSPFDVRHPDRVLLDLVTGPAASGSPIFRYETGDVLGFLIEGQIKRSAAFSIARLIYRDSTGQTVAGVLTRLEASTTQRS